MKSLYTKSLYVNFAFLCAAYNLLMTPLVAMEGLEGQPWSESRAVEEAFEGLVDVDITVRELVWDTATEKHIIFSLPYIIGINGNKVVWLTPITKLLREQYPNARAIQWWDYTNGREVFAEYNEGVSIDELVNGEVAVNITLPVPRSDKGTSSGK